ncbi:MAG: hypothetical protein V7687_10940, partial [Maribacter arcticus]|uniref:hypothetical protein n=1 Tax=Maribacter arcticus TaxID=561365 RepID=UPI003001DB6B
GLRCSQPKTTRTDNAFFVSPFLIAMLSLRVDLRSMRKFVSRSMRLPNGSRYNFRSSLLSA